MVVRNVSEMRRVWPDLTTSSGHTLELDPGEEDILLSDPSPVSFLSVRPVREPKVSVADPISVPSVLPIDETPEVNASIS